MNVAVDLSRGLFVCTTNNFETIPAPLIDRMELLEVFGYVFEDMTVISQRYLGLSGGRRTG
jgi:ATP-dependent Lon protease